MLVYAGINFTYKTSKTKQPKALLSLYKISNNSRIATRWYTVYSPKSEYMKKFHIYKCIDILYTLPKEYLNCKQNLFRKKLKTYLTTHTVQIDSKD